MSQLDPWPAEKVNRALDLREGGWSYDRIALELGCSRTKVKCELIPGYRSTITNAQADTRIRRRMNELRPVSNPKNPVYDPKRDGIPEHDNFTAEFLGDPFPGRAELMRRAG